MDFVACWYNFHWWVGLVLSINELLLEVDVKFMCPHGLSPSFYWPEQMIFVLSLATKLFAQLTLLLLYPVDESTNFLD